MSGRFLAKLVNVLCKIEIKAFSTLCFERDSRDLDLLNNKSSAIASYNRGVSFIGLGRFLDVLAELVSGVRSIAAASEDDEEVELEEAEGAESITLLASAASVERMVRSSTSLGVGGADSVVSLLAASARRSNAPNSTACDKASVLAFFPVGSEGAICSEPFLFFEDSGGVSVIVSAFIQINININGILSFKA